MHARMLDALLDGLGVAEELNVSAAFSYLSVHPVGSGKEGAETNVIELFHCRPSARSRDHEGYQWAGGKRMDSRLTPLVSTAKK